MTEDRDPDTIYAAKAEHGLANARAALGRPAPTKATTSPAVAAAAVVTAYRAIGDTGWATLADTAPDHLVAAVADLLDALVDLDQAAAHAPPLSAFATAVTDGPPATPGARLRSHEAL